MPQEYGPESSVRPITPDEVTRLQLEQFPPQVLETFNRFIAEKLMNGEAVVRQDDVVEDLVVQGLERALIFRRGWLNVEDMYREAGWKVEYDKPGYNETYPATFTFRTPKGKVS